MSTTQTAATAWKVGDVIDSRYEIRSQIGVGGMGVVLHVHHREWDRDMAVKMPLPELVGSPALKERFEREAETWVGLGVHPHIVQCWYVLNVAGLPSLFLDYMTGGSLKDRIQEGRVKPGQWVVIMEIAMEIAAGLAHAHSRGVVHRDIKPENLLFGADGRVRVTDFGLVKTALPDTIERETGLMKAGGLGVSGAGAYLGTPQYGAPEQWGSAERVGPAADVYAFGITLYELCCGRRPFDVEGDTNMTLGELIDGHCNKKPPDPREFFAGIPDELVLLCAACLEKDAARRPPNMQAVHQVLSSLHFRLTGERYPSVAALPNTVNPDIVNNTAVSLASLGKSEEARAAWRRGLRLESDHPECLYNLTQLERREGRIGHQEALRRLQQAKANYPLALYCIEQGLSKEAVSVLQSIATHDGIRKGLIQRALGDALMYTQQYFAAEAAYGLALRLMPNDDAVQHRKTAAALGRRDFDHAVLFPLSTARFTTATGQAHLRLLLSDDSDTVLVFGNSEILVIDVHTQRISHHIPREEGARPVERAWSHGNRILLQEQGAFQLRLLPDLRMLGRKGGRVLAVARDLSRMLLLTRDGTTMFSFEKNAFEPIQGAEPEEGSAGPLAAFDASGKLLSLVLCTGELAQLDAQLKAIPRDWPSAFEQPPNPIALALGSDGTTHIAYADGSLHAYDVNNRTVRYTIKLPAPAVSLQLACHDRRLICDLRAARVVLDQQGEVLWQGTGPVAIDAHHRLLTFQRGALHMYELEPFHLVRRWEQPSEAQGLAMANGGGLAASWDKAGAISLWEVYEDHRVYERSQLLSPGQSYDQLVEGAHAFPQAIAAAKQALQQSHFLEAYKQLLIARGLAGYAQMPEALDLNWMLVELMGRDQIDAVWDRAGASGNHPGPIAVSDTGDRFLAAFGRQLFLRLETASTSKVVWVHTGKGRSLAARLEEERILSLDEGGRCTVLNLQTGAVEEEWSLEQGSLVDACLAGNLVYFATTAKEVGSYDLATRRLVSKSPTLDQPIARVFPWQSGHAIVVGESQCGVVELGKRAGKEVKEFSPKGYRPTGRVTFGAHDVERRVIILGCEDGALSITDASNGKLLYAITGISGAITGFAFIPELAVGIVTTAKGQLYFWDLLADRLLQGLLAHRGAALGLSVDQRGRYLVTSGQDGQVRLWETSWTASLSTGERKELDWLPKESAFSKIANFFRGTR